MIPVVKDGKTQYQLVSFSIYANDGYFYSSANATEQSGCWGQTCVEDCGTYSGEEFASRPDDQVPDFGSTPEGHLGAAVSGGAPTNAGYLLSTARGELPDATVAGTGVAAWFATPSSANLATALTGETGSGAAVFGTSPTLATPTINGGSLSSAVTTDDETYDDTNWNADTAPASKNAVRDKLNAMRVAIPFTSGNPDTSTADGEILYFGADINTVPASGTTTMLRRLYLPPGKIVAVYGIGFCSAAGASNESDTIELRLNDTTNTTITSGFQFSSSSYGITAFNNTALSITTVAGDYCEFKVTNVTHTTDPNGAQFQGVILVAPNQ